MSETNETNLNGVEKEEGHEELKAQEVSPEETEEQEESLSEDTDESASETSPQKAQEEVDFKQKYYYLAAEMENMRKRFDREKQNLLKFGNERILSDLIEVIDNLDRTLDALEGEVDSKIKNIVVGVDMVRKQFIETLKNNGVERIEALGEKFDPNFHEAMSQQPADDKEEDTIINEFQKGYMLNGRLLRPSKVIVVKNSES